MSQHRVPIAVTWHDQDGAAQFTLLAAALVVGAVALRLIGVPPVNIHGPLHFIGVMDPLCGGTRATFLLMSGDLGGAAEYNPLVFPLSIAVLGLLARAAAGLLTGRWLGVSLRLVSRRVLQAAAVLVLVAVEVRQQLNADLLMQSWPA
jgi:hypothetical membrane protein